jgi:hypothetical protein
MVHHRTFESHGQSLTMLRGCCEEVVTAVNLKLSNIKHLIKSNLLL